MTATEFRNRLAERANRAHVTVPPTAIEPLETYLRLLSRWNSRINLTSLSLEPLTDLALDRLLLEPLAAAEYVPDAGQTWWDLGSGGGSPAIPLKIVRPSLLLTMVEAKGRKSAFLREAVRTLDLRHTSVANERVETVAGGPAQGGAKLITLRAIKGSDQLLAAVQALLAEDGEALFFHSGAADAFGPLEPVRTVQLTTEGRPVVTICRRSVPRGTAIV